jgi:hypothetical protein
VAPDSFEIQQHETVLVLAVRENFGGPRLPIQRRFRGGALLGDPRAGNEQDHEQSAE